MPYNPRFPDEKACANLPSTWGSLENAEAVWQSNPRRWAGVGFEFTRESGIFGIDLDHVYDPATREWIDWSDEFLAKCHDAAHVPSPREIVDYLGTYSEFSPSRTGVHILGGGSLPLRCTRNKQPAPDCAFEIYAERRYFTMTGNHYRWSPRDVVNCAARAVRLYDCIFLPQETHYSGPPRRRARPLSDLQIINTMRAKDDLGCALWEGCVDGYSSSSEADLALAGKLAFWAGPDVNLIIHLMRQSGMRREKYDRQDYLERTVERALSGRTEFYDWGPRHRLEIPPEHRIARQHQRGGVYRTYFGRSANHA